MLRYLGRRLAYARAAAGGGDAEFPADPHFAGRSGRDHRRLDGRHQRNCAQLRAQYGLDKPFIAQLGLYLGQVLRGDLGHSYFFNLPVTQLIWDRVPATLLLVVTSVLGAFLAGTLLGTLAARKPNGPLSQGITLLSIVGYWRRCSGLASCSSSCSRRCCRSSRCPTCARRARPSWAGPARWTCCITWCCRPALGFVYLAQYSWLARASVIEALSADYIRTARAKGSPERTVHKHALRNGCCRW